ncbi:aldo/keto reductase [Pontibacter sp. SGAir0037]|uniref:aldo/keto reductase n=1 Tax=Pontibacter sp. SGAir0037 TaxID=2571030 RepID=UPI0010CCEAD9|nr:aldo/keto reductase [Pontibacter sp. SGAir0037]QCR21579.1 aldo/keto reductase [Pontibacter sp. SGAir0037]
MELRRLGKSDVMVTPMAFGAWAIGGWMWGGAEEQAAIRAIKAAFDAGITTIDTAPVYGFGRSEELVGNAMAGVPRDQYQILTKFGMNWLTEQGEYFFDSVDNDGKPFRMYKWASKEKIMQECETSLRLLKTDYIDLYQIHWPDATTPVSETFEAVQRLIEQGKVRAAGVCNYSVELVAEALDTIQLASNQVPYSMINRGIENDVVPQALERGLGIIPYSPLQRGLLTGKIKPGHQFNEGDTREGNQFYTDENIRRTHALLEEIKPIAEKNNATLAQLAVNWTMNRPGVACVLVGARDEQQVKDNAGAMSFTLSDEELSTITAAADKFTLAS